MKNNKVLRALENLNEGDSLNYIGEGLINFIKDDPTSDTAENLNDFFEEYEIEEIEEILFTSDFCGSDWEACVNDWISKYDREEFIKNYVPEFTERYW